MPDFSTLQAPSAATSCPLNKCAAAKANDDALISAVSQRTKRLIGEDIVQDGPQPGDFGPQLTAGDWNYCQNKASQMGAVVRRFNGYSDALPSARAANDVNLLKDKPGSESKGAPCLTRLPDNAGDLNRSLGLQPGTLKDSDLRNDTTGFRAAMYRDDSTGDLILVPRDTEASTLVDWKTNIDNGQGKDTDQYAAMRKLSSKLDTAGVDYDIAGYSKGGGLAQEGGLMSSDANVYVFNSAGLPDSALTRTGATSFDSLSSRTTAFSADGDFLTYMNSTADPAKQIENARYLRSQLEGPGHFYQYDPIQIEYRNPETLAAQNQKDSAQSLMDAYVSAGMAPPPDLVKQATTSVDPAFQQDKTDFLNSLDTQIADLEKKNAAGQPFQLFPPVRSNDQQTIPGSATTAGNVFGAQKDSANFGKLVQHQMSGVLSSMQKVNDGDRQSMQDFLKQCP